MLCEFSIFAKDILKYLPFAKDGKKKTDENY